MAELKMPRFGEILLQSDCEAAHTTVSSFSNHKVLSKMSVGSCHHRAARKAVGATFREWTCPLYV